MNLAKQFESEEDRLVDDLNAGLITTEEFNREMRLLNQAFREAVDEEAQAAFDDVYGSYGWTR